MDKDKGGNHLRVWLESECCDSPRSGLDIITEEARPGGQVDWGSPKDQLLWVSLHLGQVKRGLA